MGTQDSEALAKIMEQVESIIGTLQFQVLNNVDTYVGSKNGVCGPDVLNDFVKRPIMQSVTKLKTARNTLARLVFDNNDKPSNKEAPDNGTRR